MIGLYQYGDNFLVVNTYDGWVINGAYNVTVSEDKQTVTYENRPYIAKLVMDVTHWKDQHYDDIIYLYEQSKKTKTEESQS